MLTVDVASAMFSFLDVSKAILFFQHHKRLTHIRHANTLGIPELWACRHIGHAGTLGIREHWAIENGIDRMTVAALGCFRVQKAG